MKKFQIFCRYEYIGSENGQVITKWSKWFPFSIRGVFDTEEDALIEMEKTKKENKDIERKSKSKHEYEVREVDLEPYHYMPEPTKEPKKRGRKPKVKTEE